MINELTLPEFAFLDGNDGKTDQLAGRDVILHVRSASVIEFFDIDNVVLNPETIYYRFSYTNIDGYKEHKVAALHYCATLAPDDVDFIKKNILKPAAIWYCDYCTNEDFNIFNDEDIM